MDIPALTNQLMVDEGDRQFAYQDTRGYWTIGSGRNIDRRGGLGLSEDERRYLLKNDILRVANELNTACPWWQKMTDARQNALANICFAVGLPSLLGFKNMLGAMQNEQWEAAASELESSDFYKEVGARAARLADQIRKG